MNPVALVLLAGVLLALPATSGLRRLRTVAPRGGRRIGRRKRRGGRAPSAAAQALRRAAAWDQLAACLYAGLPVADAVRAVCPALPQEPERALRSTGELLALGAEPDDAWQPALECPETAGLARAARRTARSGSALAESVRQLGQRERARAQEMAHERAERAAVLVTGPLGLCYLPAFVCLGVIPVVVGLAADITNLP